MGGWGRPEWEGHGVGTAHLPRIKNQHLAERKTAPDAVNPGP